MAKYRGRKIAGVSIANPRRIMKKVAWARAYASLHCSDGLKDELMKTPRFFDDSFADSPANSSALLDETSGKSYTELRNGKGLRTEP